MSDDEVDEGFRGLFSKLAGDVRLLLLCRLKNITHDKHSDEARFLFPVVFQDMQISATELRTILNKIVSKRKLAPKL